ncbi:MAG: aspartoacylase [Acidobacteria bacterium]|nr:aspartoacylase [Acidobacteriota bacterium]
MKINKVAIVGGTHGNVFTGTFLLRRWASNPSEITRESFITKPLWANPKAFYENKRYIDADLNRCFFRTDLNNEAIHTYEGNRAKVINAVLGPKENPAFDFTIDIHTTTSNMGVTLILVGGDKYDLRLAAFIKSHVPDVNLYYFKDQGGDHPYLTSVTPKRLGLEIGPIPQGVLRHDVFEQANDAIRLTLDYIHRVNVGDEPECDKEVEVFLHRNNLDFPVDADGNIYAMIHRNLQGKDFTELKKGDPMFITINGEVITYDEEAIAYPVFINEAAYYDKKIALSLTDKITMPL